MVGGGTDKLTWGQPKIKKNWRRCDFWRRTPLPTPRLVLKECLSVSAKRGMSVHIAHEEGAFLGLASL